MTRCNGAGQGVETGGLLGAGGGDAGLAVGKFIE